MDAAAPFEIEGSTVAEMLAWVARETGWTVRYEDEDLARAARQMPFEGGGRAARELRPDQAAFYLLPGARLEGRLEHGTLTVRRVR
jgi:hypothetical protein